MKTAATQHRTDLRGYGSPDGYLSDADLRRIVEDSLAEIGPGSKILAIVPDKTRDDSTDVLFPFAAEFLQSKKVEKFDALIAQGTHVQMTTNEKRMKIGIGDGTEIPGIGRVFVHRWSDPAELVQIGELGEEKVIELTGGLFKKAIPLRINKLLAPGYYDHILIFGATV